MESFHLRFPGQRAQKTQLKSICLCSAPLPPVSFLFPFSPESRGVKSDFLGAEISGVVLHLASLPWLQLDSPTPRRRLPPHCPTGLPRCFNTCSKINTNSLLLHHYLTFTAFPLPGPNRAQFLLHHPLPPALVFPSAVPSTQLSVLAAPAPSPQPAGYACFPPTGSKAGSSG